MKIIVTRILLSALLLLSAGCASLIQTPQVSLKEAIIKGLDGDGIDIECRLAIFNPNSFDLSLLGYQYTLQLISLPMISGKSTETIAIPGGKETLMRLPLRIDFNNFIELIKRQPDLERLPYHLNAELTLKTPLGKMVIPVEKADTILVPEKYRPGYYLKQLRNMFKSTP